MRCPRLSERRFSNPPEWGWPPTPKKWGGGGILILDQSGIFQSANYITFDTVSNHFLLAKFLTSCSLFGAQRWLLIKEHGYVVFTLGCYVLQSSSSSLREEEKGHYERKISDLETSLASAREVIESGGSDRHLAHELQSLRTKYQAKVQVHLAFICIIISLHGCWKLCVQYDQLFLEWQGVACRQLMHESGLYYAQGIWSSKVA